MLLYVFGFIFCFVQKVVLLPYNIRFSPYETGDLTTFEQEQLEVLVGTSELLTSYTLLSINF